MGKRIFILGIIAMTLFSFHTRAFSYDEIDKIAIEVEKLLFERHNKKDLVIDCLKVEEKLYLPIIELANIIDGEMILKEDKVLLKDYIDFPETDCISGEKFIYGSILKMDYENKEIIIKQYMDDNSVEINPILKVKDDVIILLERKDKRMNLDFNDLKIGDRLGIILDKNNMARSIILSI